MRTGALIIATCVCLAGACGEDGPTTEFVPGDHLGSPEAVVADVHVGLDTTTPPADSTSARSDSVQEELFQGLLDFRFPNDANDAGQSQLELPEGDLSPYPFCHPNHNGIIEADEVPAEAALGLVATYTVNQPGTKMTVQGLTGKFLAEEKQYTWDFTQPGPADIQQHESALPLSAFWFEERFPDADFAQPFSGDYLGVYRKDEQGLQMLGVASYEEDDTVLEYETPVTLVPFPLKLAMAWNANEVHASGVFEGDEYPVDYGLAGEVSVTHTYSFMADKRGLVSVPAGQFEVVRVYIDLTMTVWNSKSVLPVFERRVKLMLFLGECIGTVALVRSDDDETQKEFELVTEFKRLGF